MGYQNVVDASQFDIDLETQVGEGLRGGLHHILHLNTLSGHSQKSVSDTFHFRCRKRTETSVQQPTAQRIYHGRIDSKFKSFNLTKTKPKAVKDTKMALNMTDVFLFCFLSIIYVFLCWRSDCLLFTTCIRVPLYVYIVYIVILYIFYVSIVYIPYAYPYCHAV